MIAIIYSIIYKYLQQKSSFEILSPHINKLPKSYSRPRDKKKNLLGKLS